MVFASDISSAAILSCWISRTVNQAPAETTSTAAATAPATSSASRA
jgi:hypothetical protein